MQKNKNAENCQRVPLPDAAKELGISADYLRFLMRAKKVDLGMVLPPKSKNGRCEYLVFRAKLDRFMGLDIEDSKRIIS